MFEKFLSDKQVEKRYVKAGAKFGAAMSYVLMGKCYGFDTLYANWAKWELEYSKRGFRTLPLEKFINYGGYGAQLKGIGVHRAKSAQPVLYAKNFNVLSWLPQGR